MDTGKQALFCMRIFTPRVNGAVKQALSGVNGIG
jgi:hypothetical protein